MRYAGITILPLVFSLLSGCGDPQTDEQQIAAELKAKAEENAKAKQIKQQRVGDIKAGALIAKQCVPCHGKNGTAAHMGAPFIAGLDQDYMVQAMIAYTMKKGRDNAVMKAVVAKLKPEQIANVSAYYASLDTPWSGYGVGLAAERSIVTKANIAAGATIASRCNSCHGPHGTAIKDQVLPALAGTPPGYFQKALKAYFTGERKHDIMSIFKTSTTDQEIRNLAAYYAAQDPARPPRPSRGNRKAGEAAAAPCAGCHGIDGNSINPDIPNLAGHPMEYIEKAIKDYRDGHRKDALMKAAVRGMKNRTVTDLAAWYASQKPESPLRRKLAEDKRFDPLAGGKRLASSCDGCHGKHGNGGTPGTPSLNGLHAKYLIAASMAYKDGSRQHAVMKKMISALSDTDIEKVAYYYATQQPSRQPPPVRADLAAGKSVAAGCEACHGKGGISHEPLNPSLAGQDTPYLVSAIRAYANGTRVHEGMAGPAKELKPADLNNVAAYFGSLTPEKPHTVLPDNPQHVITEKCNRCHGDRGFSTEDGIPRLAGQSEAYLTLAMKEYQEGTRHSATMHAMAGVLSLLEIKAIAHYYAKQKPAAKP